eukprot:2160158-Prorocentrum_lima.AAC.1
MQIAVLFGVNYSKLSRTADIWERSLHQETKVCTFGCYSGYQDSAETTCLPDKFNLRELAVVPQT